MQLVPDSLAANLIDGRWVEPAAGRVIEVVNPSNLEVIGRVPDRDPSEAALAADAAGRAAPGWAATPAVEREALLMRAADLMERHREALAHLITLEQGKPLAESRGEIDYGVSFVRWYAAEGRRLYGEIVPAQDPAKYQLVFREPVGPTLLVSSGNDPFAMIARKGAPALAAGCPLVVKPHRETPFSALAAARLFEAAGLPPGVVNVITTTRSDDACRTLLAHPAVRHITFTGSSAVGRHLGGQAGALMKGMTMELGGHAPFVVHDDADLDLAAGDLLARKFTNAGQTCSCPARMFLHDSIAAPFLERFLAGMEAIVVGDGMDPAVTMGPLQNEGAVEKTRRHLRDALDKGARLLGGGGDGDGGSSGNGNGGRLPGRRGHFHPPAALIDATSDMLVMHEETFGPVAAFVRFREEEALFRNVNHPTYGLTAYCYTRDLARAFRTAAAFRCGFVGVNDRRPQGTEVPMGGVGESGLGREGGHWGIEEFTSTKYVSMRV